MVEPIRFGMGGARPSIIVRKDSELDSKWEKVNYAVKSEIEKMDNLLDDSGGSGDSSGSGGSGQFSDQGAVEEAFNEQERRITDAVRLFQETIAQTRVDETLSEDEALTLKEKLEEMHLFSEDLPKIVAKKVIKRRAILVTKWFWQQIGEIREALMTENSSSLDKCFASVHVRKNLRLFRQVIDEIDHCMGSTQGLKNNALYVAMIAKGKVLEIKEDLILSFTEYKRIISQEFPNYLKSHPEMHVKKAPPQDPALKLHPLQMSKEQALSHSYPTIFKRIQLGIRYQRLTNRINESREVGIIGGSMHNEGLALRSQATNFLSKGSSDKEEITHFGELLKHGSHLIAIGTDLKEKAILVHDEISEELAALKNDPALQTSDFPIDLMELAKTSAEILQAIATESKVMPAPNEFHYVGIGMGRLGVVVGKASILHSHTFVSIAGVLANKKIVPDEYLSIVEIHHA